jgi:hypothetical protein
MFCHVINDLLDSDGCSVLNYTLVDGSDDTLDKTELLEEFTTCFEDFLREDIFLTVDPEIGETFLCRVEYLS